MEGQRSAVQAGGHVLLLCGLGVAGEWDAGKLRADERTRTADLEPLYEFALLGSSLFYCVR